MSNLDEVLTEELKMLVRATRNERFRFIIVQFNYYGLIKKVETSLKNTYPHRQLHHIDISETNTYDFVSSIFDCKEGFVLINNFEKLFEENYRPLALGLNQRRDKFANYPIILLAFVPWGNSYLQACQKAMPDMFSLANPIIQLQQEVEKTHARVNIQNIQLDEVYFKNSAEAQEEIDRIETRLMVLEDLSENFRLNLNLNNRLAQSYRFLGNFEKAKDILGNCLKQLEHKDGEYSIELNDIENNLALVLKELGDYQGAKKLLEKSTIFKEINFGEKHPNTAVSYSNLAVVLQELGDYERAKKLLEKATISSEYNLGEKHPTTAVQYSNLALVLRDLGDFEGAKKLLEKALISDENNFGEKHPTTAGRYSNLALVLQDLGDYQGAKKLLEKATISDEINFGEKHPKTTTNYFNLACNLKYLGDYEGAKKLLTKAMISDETNFGEKHPLTAHSYFNLAVVMLDLGDYERAKKLLEKAFNVYKTQFGEQHPKSKIILDYLSLVKSKMT